MMDLKRMIAKSLCRRQNSNPNRPQTPPTGDTALRSLRNNEDDVRSKNILWPDMKKDNENKVQDCTACLASGKNLKYQLPKKKLRKTRETIRTRTRNLN